LFFSAVVWGCFEKGMGARLGGVFWFPGGGPGGGGGGGGGGEKYRNESRSSVFLGKTLGCT